MQKAVVYKFKGKWKAKFIGTHDECIKYMRQNGGWKELININEDGTFGRLSSWVL